MAVRGLIYATSFEHNSTTTMGREGWDTTNASINTTNYHTENGVGEPHSLNIDGASASGPRTPSKNDAQRIAFWLRPGNTASVTKFAMIFGTGSGEQVYLEWQTDGTVKVYRGDDIFGTLLVTTGVLLDRSLANWVAVRLIADNSGTLTIAINGTQVYTTTAYDLQAIGSAGWTRCRFATPNFTSDNIIDNLLMFDSSGSWLPGPIVCQVKTVSSVVSGALTGSASTGASRWENVDVAGGSTPYNEAAAAGDGDVYGCTALSTMGDVLAVVVCLEAERAGGITTLEAGVKSGGTTDYDTAHTLAVSGFEAIQSIWEEDPNTVATWTSSNASAADIAARFQA
jgi:hypothetical protein